MENKDVKKVSVFWLAVMLCLDSETPVKETLGVKKLANDEEESDGVRLKIGKSLALDISEVDICEASEKTVES